MQIKGRDIRFYVRWKNCCTKLKVLRQLQQFYEDEVNEIENNQRSQRRHRYSLSKRVAKKEAIAISLKDKCQKLKVISYPLSPPRVGEIFTANIMCFESQQKIIREAIEILKNDEFKRISICGMGGVGKTTTLKEVIKIVDENKLFDKVALSVVSQHVDYWRIQGDIAGMLGLEFGNETLQGRASKLLDRLKNINKVLIVLDDIWTELDFECIGIPSSIEYHKGCKILFTSRDEHVCDKMGSQKNFTIETLFEDEAWELFREMAGCDICDNPNMHPIAKKVANECGGLPIAIVTVGKMLINKKKHTWELVSTGIENNGGDDEKEKAKIVEFAKLVYIELVCLPRLKSFCLDSEIVWPSLKELRIDSCDELNVIQIQKVIESAKQDNPLISSNIDCSTPASDKGSTSFFRCCFGYANKSSIKASSPEDPSVPSVDETEGASNEGEIRIRRVPFMDGFLLPNLTSLQIQRCHKINSMFSLSSSTSLECLQQLEIVDCDNTEEIVLGDKETETSDIVFPGLRLLKLGRLRNFRSFCSSSHHWKKYS